MVSVTRAPPYLRWTETPDQSLRRHLRSCFLVIAGAGRAKAFAPLGALCIEQAMLLIVCHYWRQVAAGGRRLVRNQIHEAESALDRAHFFAVVANIVRRVLVDATRAKTRQKRGGGVVPGTFDEQLQPGEAGTTDLLALDEALDISVATVERDLKTARVFLHREFGANSSHDSLS